MAQTATSTDQQLLNRVQMRPIWDAEGNLVGITELEVESDRRLGIQAMKDLMETRVEGDENVCADGWTMKQKRIVSSKAPNACHYLRTSRRWDATAGAMVPKVTILLPTEVIWTLFDMLFDGQYSITVDSLESHDEEIMPSSEVYRDVEADNMPGRRFYTRARVSVTIHLANGRDRVFQGMGVAFGDVPMHKIGNIAAINNEQRTTEKGAINDAKREALANIGPVFRRAFEDGDEMIAEIERMLLADLQDRNRPKIQVVSNRDKVAAPAPRRKQNAVQEASSQEAALDDRPPALDEDDLDAAFGPTGPAQVAQKTESADAAAPAEPEFALLNGQDEATTVSADTCLGVFLDIAMGECETAAQLDALVAKNETVLSQLVPDRSEIDALRADMDEAADGIPDFEPAERSDTSAEENEGETGEEEDTSPKEAPAEVSGIEVGKKSGKMILEEFTERFLAAKSAGEIDQIIAASKAAIRKMTPKQLQAMTDRKSERIKKLKNA